MIALNSAIRMTAIAASSSAPDRDARAGSPAVRYSATVETRSVMTSRFSSARRPPRHSHRMRIWVL